MAIPENIENAFSEIQKMMNMYEDYEKLHTKKVNGTLNADEEVIYQNKFKELDFRDKALTKALSKISTK